MPTFTQDWFSHNIPGMEQMLARVPAKRRFLEIGCFEGMATCWLLTHHLDPDGKMVCIDTFKGGAEHVVTKFDGVAARFRANANEAKKPGQELVVIENLSHIALAQLIADGDEFDFIYVDGSHLAPDVMTDACMAYRVLKVGGIMVFDDYMWGAERPLLETPKFAVDAFTTLFRERVNIVMLSYQLAVQKTK